MTAEKYRRKTVVGPVPEHATGARIVLEYTDTGGRAVESAELLEESLDSFKLLCEHGFVGARGVQVSVQGRSSELLETRIGGRGFSIDAVVVAFRMVIGVNDSDPVGYAELLRALDGDEQAAHEIYAGIDFERDVAGIKVDFEGDGIARQRNIWHLGGVETEMRHVSRLVVPNAASCLPSADLEDAMLRVSAMRGFVPVSADIEYELGDEEWFARGGDLIVDRLSVESSALRELLEMLGAQGAGGA